MRRARLIRADWVSRANYDPRSEPHYAAMTADEMRDYWSRKNVESIDGLPTYIFID